jgi:outer membrane protein assembly factor BamD (BamD/ComL family)
MDRILIKKISFIFFIFIITLNLYPADKKDWVIEEQKARKLFDQNKFDESIILFREIILSTDRKDLQREAYFWIAKAYMNSDKLSQAETNIEYYLANYKDEALNFPEAVYQKGRLLFLQEQYQSSIDILNTFIKNYNTNDLVSNAYYWIGESLYALGQYDDSAMMFKIVIDNYPNSVKTEACIYKLRLIEHKKSELALQNLLKWSQEQFISSLNQFKVKEKTLQQAINEYEKKQGVMINQNEYDDLKKTSAENDDLKKKVTDLENQIKDLENNQTLKDLSERLRQLKLREDLLDQKEQALRLLEQQLNEKEKLLEK